MRRYRSAPVPGRSKHPIGRCARFRSISRPFHHRCARTAHSAGSSPAVTEPLPPHTRAVDPARGGPYSFAHAHETQRVSPSPLPARWRGSRTGPHSPRPPSALLDTRVIYCGDCLEQLRTLASLRGPHSTLTRPSTPTATTKVFWGETKEKRAFETATPHPGLH